MLDKHYPSALAMRNASTLIAFRESNCTPGLEWITAFPPSVTAAERRVSDSACLERTLT